MIYGAAVVTYTKSSRKLSSFPAEMPPIKSVGAANRQSSAVPRKFVALYHSNTKIRMRSDEREKDLEEMTADLSLRRNNLFQSLGYCTSAFTSVCSKNREPLILTALHSRCTNRPAFMHSMNVSGNPTPVIIDQVREIRFQQQANSFGSQRTC